MKQLAAALIMIATIPLCATQTTQLELMIIKSDISNIEFMLHEIVMTSTCKDRLIELAQDMIIKRLTDLECWNTSVDKSKTLCHERIMYNWLMRLTKWLAITGTAGTSYAVLGAFNEMAPRRIAISALTSLGCYWTSYWCATKANETVEHKRRRLEQLYINAIRIKQILYGVMPITF